MAGKGFRELKGATGKIVVVRSAPSGFHQTLSGVQIASVTNTISPVCSSETMQEIKQALSKRAGEVSEDMEGGGSNCTLDVEVQFYQDAGGLASLLGKQSLLIGRAKLAAESSDASADVLVIATSKAMRTGASALADAFAQTLVDYCREGEADD
jgi:hypothetical protein